MSKRKKNKPKVFVTHDCKNCKKGTCNNRFIFYDWTRAKDRPPTWAYCPECCEKLGINFEEQQPCDERTEENEKQLKNLKSCRDNAPD